MTLSEKIVFNTLFFKSFFSASSSRFGGSAFALLKDISQEERF